jgi:hypothetical protein
MKEAGLNQLKWHDMRMKEAGSCEKISKLLAKRETALKTEAITQYNLFMRVVQKYIMEVLICSQMSNSISYSCVILAFL